MGMPITAEIVDDSAKQSDIEAVFSYFKYVDEKFSTYKSTSEISKINDGQIKEQEYSDDMVTVLSLCEELKNKTDGYFNITTPQGKIDPSGLVKGWSIYNAVQILMERGFKNFYIDAGGDIEARGKNNAGKDWKVGIKNPFNQDEIVKVLGISGAGVATSGTYIRGQHIYNPKNNNKPAAGIVSLTVVGPNVYDADVYATPAFAMGQAGINFIESLKGLEGYMIDKDGVATMTSGFQKFVSKNA